jgi:methylmalonyl-CoA/ethylmalonyl-CoA epimerase
VIGRINHIAIAVPDVMAAARQWENILGAKVSAPQTLPEHGVRIVFVIAPNGKVELMEPFGEASPIASFLARNENGGIHHICYEVDDIVSATDSLKAAGARVLDDGASKIGAHGNPVLFLHPKDFNGTLIELEQVAETSELSQKN